MGVGNFAGVRFHQKPVLSPRARVVDIKGNLACTHTLASYEFFFSLLCVTVIYVFFQQPFLIGPCIYHDLQAWPPGCIACCFVSTLYSILIKGKLPYNKGIIVSERENHIAENKPSFPRGVTFFSRGILSG